MSIERFANELGGESLRLGPRGRLQEIPTPFAEAITDEYRDAFEHHSQYFSDLAAVCSIPIMDKWLRCLAEAASCELEVILCDWTKKVIVRVAGFDVSLKKPIELTSTASGLHDLYSLISEIHHGGVGHAGGIHTPSTVQECKNAGLVIESEIGVPGDAMFFFTTASGDSLIAINETACWYSHETCGLADAGLLTDAIAEYFGHLLAGTPGDFRMPY